MTVGRLDEAITLIDSRLATEPADVPARFLKGMIAVAKGNQRMAIGIFRRILIDHPDAGRVRLELARAFFLDRDYGNSLRQFQFALAGDPPPAVVSNIKRYISAIREAKTLSYSFGIAVAPDSNLNTGSSAREVSLFGLPFDLSDEARKRSGIGLAVEAGGEWAPRIGKGARLRIGLNTQRRDYKGADFDDTTLAAFVGPRIVRERWDVSLLATAYKRWFGSQPYNQAKGARIEASYTLTPRIGLSAAASAQWIRHDRDPARDGRALSLYAGAFHALTPSSTITVKAGVSRNTAQAAPYSNWTGFAAVGHFRELPAGFSAYIEPSLSVARYDEALFGFGSKRADNGKSVLVTLLNRGIVLSRFTPRISYTYTKQKSSIPLYEFSRNRVDVGLTTAF